MQELLFFQIKSDCKMLSRYTPMCFTCLWVCNPWGQVRAISTQLLHAHCEMHGRKISAPVRLENPHEQVAETPSTCSQRPVEITPPSYLVRAQFHLSLFLKTWDKENAFMSSMCLTILWNTNLASSQLMPVTLQTFSLCLPSSCILGYKKSYKWRNRN